MLSKIVLAAAMSLAVSTAFGADMVPVKAPRVVADCTQMDCTGWIVGANIMGSGSNADILGSGLNGSVFAGGGLIGVEAGYQLWNGKLFGGATAGCDYDANLSGVATPNPGRWLCMGLFQAGIGLSGVFASSPSSPPVGIPATIASALVSPYLEFGVAVRPRGDAWVSGAGAEFGLSKTWLLRLDYLHLNYAHGQSGMTPVGIVDQSSVENLVKLSLLRKL